MTQHTPGKWSINRENKKRLRIAGNGYVLAELTFSGPESEANAQLIAKAYLLPELVEALEDLLIRCNQEVQSLVRWHEEINAQKALKKYRESAQ